MPVRHNIIRNCAQNSFTAPVILFNATLVLWLFAKSQNSANDIELGDPSTETPALFRDSHISVSDQTNWLNRVSGQPKLSGIGWLVSVRGRRKLLEVAADMMGGLVGWKISQIYRQILLRLLARDLSNEV